VNKAEVWEVVKTLIAIVYGVLGVLAVFGPLAEYREWLVLAASIVAIIASALGVTLTKPAEQISDIKERKAEEAVAASK
jgi:hypothetical protein